MVAALDAPNPLDDYPELRQLGPSFDLISDFYVEISLAVYGIVLVVSVLYQGGNALYYFTRRRLVIAYVNETEPWVIKLQRSTD